MPELTIQRRLLRWGNAYGIRVTKAEAEALQVREKQELRVELRAGEPRIDLSKITFVRGGLRTASRDHDHLAEEGFRAGY